MSPVLFSLYLNDLERYLQYYNCSGVCPDIDGTGILLDTGTCLLCLLYVDGTALLATNASHLHNYLDIFCLSILQ